MTIQEFYISIGEDFNEMVNRYFSIDRVKKYALMFLKDESYPNLVKMLNEKDYETAFRMAHTLKGVSANLGFNKLFEVSSALTEVLRHKEYDADLNKYLKDIEKEYIPIIEKLNMVE